MTVVLDACAIIWAVSEPERLPGRVAALLETADTKVCVSAISCAEIACAAERGRIELDRLPPCATGTRARAGSTRSRTRFRHGVCLHDAGADTAS